MAELGKTVSSKILKEQIYFDSDRDLREYLTSLGYTKYGQVNVGGTKHVVWYKGIYPKTVVKTFRESLKKD